MDKTYEFGNKIHEICDNCGDKHCCHGLCKEINDYLVEKRKEKK